MSHSPNPDFDPIQSQDNLSSEEDISKANKDTPLPEGYLDPTGPAAYRARQSKMDDLNGLDTEAQAKSGSAENKDDNNKLMQLEQTLAQTHDQLLRTVAELDNMRKRAQREREDASKYAVANFARDLLDVADTFKRALGVIPDELKQDERNKSVIEGLEAMERVLLRCFEKNGIRRIEPMDTPFDPHFHEVMFEAPFPDKAQGTIIQLIEPGYMLHDRLLRPARVGVAKSIGAEDTASGSSRLDTQA